MARTPGSNGAVVGRGMALLMAAALVAGCAGVPGREPGKSQSFTFRINTDAKGCPISATVPVEQRNCGCWLSRRPDCVKAYPGDSVQIVPAQEAKLSGSFQVFFDPFHSGPVKAPPGEPLRIDRNAPPKSYRFNIVVEGCPVLDPEIVVIKQ